MVTVAEEIPPRHRVVACTGGSHTRLESRPTPIPANGELLLRLRVVGLCGTDLFKLATGAATPGLVLGHELVGEVAAVGDDAGDFHPGDRIVVPHHVACGDCDLCRRGADTMCPVFRENLLEPGGFAEHVVVRGRARRQAARRIPDALPDEAAVFLEPAACVLRGVRRGGVAATDTVLVIGGGSMGLLHLLVLRAAVPGVQVVVSEPLEERRDLASRLGACAAVVPGDATIAAAMDLSSGLGVDVTFDTVGGPAPLAIALAGSREGGTVVLFAHAPEGARADFDLNALFKYERRIVGTYSGGLEEQAAIFRMLCDRVLDPSPLVTHRLPLEDFAHGIDLSRTGRALKVLYTPAAPE